MAELKNFLIERTIPGVMDWDAATRQGVAAASNAVVGSLNASAGDVVYEWVGSVATGPNTLVCHHRATDPELVRKHSQIGGFPCDSVAEGDTLPPGSMHLGPGDAVAKTA